MKPLIFCIVGESGVGKTMVADYLEELTGISMIKSWTDRPKRSEDETGHAFVSKKKFDQFEQLEHEGMIAFTEWEGYRYCCFHSDVKDINTYVIDEFGLQYLKDSFSERYWIVSIRIHRPLKQRIKAVGKKRTERDKDKFALPDSYYDHVVHNKGESKFLLLLDVWNIIREYL